MNIPIFNDPYSININETASIDEACKLTDSMRSELKKYTTLEKLAYENEVAVVRNEYLTNRIDGYLPAIHLIKCAYSAKDGAERNSAKKLLGEWFKENLTGCSVKIVDIHRCGYETYGYTVIISCKGTKFVLTVPNAAKLTKDNYNYVYRGVMQLGYYANDSTIVGFASAYSFKDISNAFKVYFDKMPAKKQSHRK